MSYESLNIVNIRYSTNNNELFLPSDYRIEILIIAIYRYYNIIVHWTIYSFFSRIVISIKIEKNLNTIFESIILCLIKIKTIKIIFLLLHLQLFFSHSRF